MSVSGSGASRRADRIRLPAEVSSFIGRRQEIAEVKHLLAESRMVTLTGPGGVGKTRLALRVATELRRAFPDGVWLVELAELDNPRLLAEAVVAALEIPVRTSRTPIDILVEHLEDKSALVVLDNCEHVLQESAHVTQRLLCSVPQLRILATSRQPLGIFGEQRFMVPPLRLADDHSRQDSSFVSSEAVQLFADRAAAMLPGFTVGNDNREVIEQICRRLDGLPLAIELAAARLRALSPEQVLARLDNRFQLLTNGPRTAQARHRTLLALIDWSHALCTAQERLMWARVSVFTGSLDLQAAEEVCAGDGIKRKEVIDLLAGLVDKSVLGREESSGTVRYRLLDTIREYGRERLDASGKAAAVKLRYRDYYRRLSHDAKLRMFGPAQVELLVRMRIEHSNLRTALEYCHAEHAGLCIDMASDLLPHWISGCHMGEGRNWLELGLADAGGTPGAVRARALCACSWLAIIQGDHDAAESMLEESRELAERLRLEPILGYVALDFGMIALHEADTESAVGHFEDAVARHRVTGDPLGQVLALIRLSLTRSLMDDSQGAVAAAEEGIAICAAHRESWQKANATMALAIATWRQGDAGRAASLVRESLRFHRSIDDSVGIGLNVDILAWIAATRDRYERAGEMLGIVHRVWQAVGAPLPGYGYLSRYHDECLARTRDALGEPGLRAALERGGKLSLDEAIAHALRERPASSRPSDRLDRRPPLTARETQIARLVAQGMSNKEIAASLVIAQRTAEGHVENILSKLGFGSRSQIAAWIAGQRPPSVEEAECGDG